MILLGAITRNDVADYLSTLITVYVLLIVVYIITTLIFSFGGRVPYNRWSNAILTFLRDVSEPYLRIFRRFIPPIGPLDISPIVAILVLQIGGGLIVGAIRP
ncbi:MAG: YggT family protein [Solirubrobacteraceae bacterium]|nr:YggT family protein [Solirubrobacteraceae bacterium]